jgi:hypothetical protein
VIVYLDGRLERFHPGATVSDLAGRLDDADRRAWRDDRAFLADSDGHELGEGGGLSDGATYQLIHRRG